MWYGKNDNDWDYVLTPPTVTVVKCNCEEDRKNAKLKKELEEWFDNLLNISDE